MPLDEEKLWNIRTALEAGDRTKAKDLLTRHLRREPDDAEAWVWMSVAVETPRERIYCLKEALRVDPELQSAKHGLAMLGAGPVDPDLVVPPQFEHRKWLVLLEKVPKMVAKLPVKQLLLYAGAAALFIGLIVFVIFGVQLVRDTISASRATIDYRPIPSATSATGSPPPPTATSTPSEPTPPWAVLAEPYTPTPAYVRTPHAIIEAYSIAIRAVERQDNGKALTYMIQAATSQPGTADLPYQIGELYRTQGDYGKAIESYNQSIAVNPGFAPAYLGRVQAGLASGAMDGNSARNDLQSAVTLDPGFGEAHIELARLNLQDGLFPETIDQLSAAEQSLPGSPWVYFLRGLAYMAQGNAVQALEQANRANQLDLTLLPVYRLTGQALQADGKLVESIVPLEIFLRYYREPDAGAQVMMARAYAAGGQLEKAITAATKALEISPDDADVIALRGEIYMNTQQADLALEDFRTAFHLNPDLFDAGIGIGRALLAQGDYSGGYSQINNMEGYAQNDGQKALVYYWRAQSFEKLENTDAALADWQRLLDLPEAVVPADWRQTANQRILALNTPASTATPTP